MNKNAREKKLIQKMREYAKEHEYNVQELYSSQTADYSPESHFLFQWKNGHIDSARIGAPPALGVMKELGELFLRKVDIAQSEGDFSWMGELNHVETLSIEVWQEDLPEMPRCVQSLHSLWLRFPKASPVRAIPNCVRNLRNLKSLSIRSPENYLSIPDWIGEMERLDILSLRGCRLESLPSSLLNLKLAFITDAQTPEREGIYLYGVSTKTGEGVTLFEQSREFIEVFYKGQRGERRECKVIFLGEGKVGKTSLIERLIHNKELDTKQATATKGIKMSTWTLPGENGEDYRLRVMDFGGQEIMHAMHRCFLTDHTIYVVVCESRNDGVADNTAEKWLKTINAYTQDCPVFLVLNKSDEYANAAVNTRNLQAINAGLRMPVLNVSAKNGNGREALIDIIRERIPYCMNSKTFNVAFQQIEWDLEQRTEPYIDSDDYKLICAAHGVTDSGTQKKMLNWFRDLGIVYFYENVGDYKILNPEWLTNGMYRIIHQTGEDGIFKRSEIKRFLSEPYPEAVYDFSYNGETAEYIFQVMRQFELSLELEDDYELIPMKLPKNPPISIPNPPPNAFHLRWEAKSDTYLPENLIHRLMIQKSEELDKTCMWRTGARFKSKNGDVTIIELSESRSRLDVVVHKSDNPDKYVQGFRECIQRLLSQLRLHATEYLRMTRGDKEAMISYDDVMAQWEKGRLEVWVPEFRDCVPTATILHHAKEYAQTIEAIHSLAKLIEKSGVKDDELRKEILKILRGAVNEVSTKDVNPEDLRKIEDALSIIDGAIANIKKPSFIEILNAMKTMLEIGVILSPLICKFLGLLGGLLNS